MVWYCSGWAGPHDWRTSTSSLRARRTRKYRRFARGTFNVDDHLLESVDEFRLTTGHSRGAQAIELRTHGKVAHHSPYVFTSKTRKIFPAKDEGKEKKGAKVTTGQHNENNRKGER